MSRCIPRRTGAKTAHNYTVHTVRGKVNGTVPKRFRPIMAETDCPAMAYKHLMFDPWLANGLVGAEFASL